MIPRLKYGSNLAANWAYLYKEFGETERVIIYQLDGNSRQANALFAYDVTEKYLTPGRIRHAKDCCREPALKAFVSRCARISALPVSRPTRRAASARFRPGYTAAISITGGSVPVRRCIIRSWSMARCFQSVIRTSPKAMAN
jgi:hypothetical protein